MRRTFSAVLTVLALAAAPGAQQPRQHEVALEAAMRTETVDGDLRKAIGQYEALAKSGDRIVAAKALLRMAECYHKLGDAQAKATYERLVRDFADQKDAVAVARARLGDSAAPSVASKGDRAVWTGRDVDLFGTISPDGRYLTYVDWGGFMNVLVRDLVAGTSRPLTPNTRSGEFGIPSWSAISRDGDQVVYAWDLPNRREELRVASLRATGIPSFRVVREAPEGEFMHPFDWSPDGKFVAVELEREDRSSQIGVLSVQDGSLRGLKSIDWRGVGKMVFSPDGRFIAYDLLADTRDRMHIYVMAVDGSREALVVDDASNNHVMGWAADGQLVFASDRTGSRSLWTVLVEDGRAKNAPRLAKDNIGSTWSLGLTPGGTLFLWQHASPSFVRVAPFDLATGTIPAGGSTIFQRFVDSRGRPAWSPDGRWLSYISCSADGAGPCNLFVRSGETGAVRQVPHELGYLAFPRLSPDGRTIVANGTDLKGRQGVQLIDVATGKTTTVKPFTNPLRSRNPEWSADGRAIRYMENHDADAVLVEHEVGTQQTHEVFRTASANINTIRVSPDGKRVGFVRNWPDSKGASFVVAELPSGEPRVVFEATGTFAINGVHWHWMPDSQSVIVMKGAPSFELWQLPLTGVPRKLAVDARQWGEGFQINPDGRSIAFVAQAGESGAEVWALENFLPRTKIATR